MESSARRCWEGPTRYANLRKLPNLRTFVVEEEARRAPRRTAIFPKIATRHLWKLRKIVNFVFAFKPGQKCKCNPSNGQMDQTHWDHTWQRSGPFPDHDHPFQEYPACLASLVPNFLLLTLLDSEWARVRGVMGDVSLETMDLQFSLSQHTSKNKQLTHPISGSLFHYIETAIMLLHNLVPSVFSFTRLYAKWQFIVYHN